MQLLTLYVRFLSAVAFFNKIVPAISFPDLLKISISGSTINAVEKKNIKIKKIVLNLEYFKKIQHILTSFIAFVTKTTTRFLSQR